MTDPYKNVKVKNVTWILHGDGDAQIVMVALFKPKEIILTTKSQNHWFTANNIEIERNSVPISLVNPKVFIYDSFNNLYYLDGMRSILSNMFPTYDKFVVHCAKIFNTQVSTNDCGLFALPLCGSIVFKI